ncbi:MAG: hypothetical protein WD767_16890 [Alphaproteobacteria bacterium]
MFGIRLVPVTIFVATLMLTVKLGNIWSAVSDDSRAIEVGSVAAQEKPAVAEMQTASDETEKAQAEAVGGDSEAPQEIQDVSKMSHSEIRLLQELAERRELLDRRERELDQRSVLLKAAEQRIVEKQEEFKKIRIEIKGLLDIKEKEELERLNRLVGIYSNMKPKDAATIFNELDMVVLLDVMKSMSARKVAPIIAAMDAERARKLTQQLAEHRLVPAVPN